MNKAKAIAGIITIFVVMPIWFYLLYKILVYVEATDLMWFLYFAYLPAGILAHILTALAAAED